MDSVNLEVVIAAGDEPDYESLPDDVRLWLLLDSMAKLCGNPQPALRSLFWYQVMTLCEMRFAYFRWTDAGLVRVKR